MRIEHGQRIRSVAIAGAAAGRQAPGAGSPSRSPSRGQRRRQSLCCRLSDCGQKLQVRWTLPKRKRFPGPMYSVSFFFYVGLQLLILSLARRIFWLERTSRRWQPLASDHCVCQPVRALWLISTISIFTRTYWGLARGGFVTFGFYFRFRFRFCFWSCQAQLNEGHSVWLSNVFLFASALCRVIPFQIFCISNQTSCQTSSHVAQ